MNNSAIISCITPTFNRAHLLKNAIDSVINQTFSHWEMIIIDDNSKDYTEEMVSSYSCTDKRIRYFRNPGKGGGAARNFGISQATGKYIVFLDDDDICLPHRFASQLRAVKNSGYNFIVSGYQIRDYKTNRVVSENMLELRGAGAGFPSRWLIAKTLLDQIGGFDESFPSMQDIELSYRLAALETFALHKDIVAIIYHTDESVSSKKDNALKGRILLMERFGNMMDPAEAGWWYFIIGIDNYYLGQRESALYYFRKAASIGQRANYSLGFTYARLIISLGGKAKRLNLKILKMIGDYRFPVLVNHPVVS